MDEPTILKQFEDEMNSMTQIDQVEFDILSNYAIDYSKCKDQIVALIFDRIQHPEKIPEACVFRNGLPYFYLIDALAKNCPEYKPIIQKGLSDVILMGTRSQDLEVRDEVTKMCGAWKNKSIFDSEIIDEIESKIEVQKEIPKEVPIVVEKEQPAESFIFDSTPKHQEEVASIPASRGWMRPLSEWVGSNGSANMVVGRETGEAIIQTQKFH